MKVESIWNRQFNSVEAAWIQFVPNLAFEDLMLWAVTGEIVGENDLIGLKKKEVAARDNFVSTFTNPVFCGHDDFQSKK